MAKKHNGGKVPKRILGMKVPKHLRRAGQPVAQFLDTEFGRGLAVDTIVALAVALASTERMRASFQDAAKRARRSGAGFADLALHLGLALVLPALVALHAQLPGEIHAVQQTRARRENQKHSSDAVH